MKKIALVHDALINKGGAERVFQVFCEMFPKAPIFTSVYFPEKTLKYFKNRKIFTTSIQKYVKNENQYKKIFPVTNYFMQKFDFGSFDIILSSTTFCAKYINKKDAIHISYMHQPFRLLWYKETYIKSYFDWYKMLLLYPFIKFLRKLDYKATNKIDIIISNSQVTKTRVMECYDKDSRIINPPLLVNNNYNLNQSSNNYFLVVSRLEPYKNVDLVIKAFNILNIPLVVIGVGSMFEKLQKLAKSNIKFLNNVNDHVLKDYYANCKALVFPQEEDFGLTPLEANAFGKPVICYGRGGVKETMVPYDSHNVNNATALFFYEQNVDSIIKSIKLFLKIKFNTKAILDNVKRFDKQAFEKKIHKIIFS